MFRILIICQGGVGGGGGRGGVGKGIGRHDMGRELMRNKKAV